MNYDIDKFAETNFHNFSPKERKTNNLRLISFGAVILGTITLYFYFDNKRKEKHIQTSFAEIKRLQNEIDTCKKKMEDNLPD